MARVSQARPGKFVDNDDVDFCMIDLHDLKRTANCIFPRDCCGRLDDIAFAAPLAPNPDVDCFHTSADCSAVRRSNALLSASGVYAVDKMGQRWSCGFEINIVDCLLDDLLRGFGQYPGP
jgi:hypothetical protein